MEGFHRTDSSEKLLVIFSFFRSIRNTLGFVRYSCVATLEPFIRVHLNKTLRKVYFLFKSREIAKMERRKFERIVHSREKSDLST